MTTFTMKYSKGKETSFICGLTDIELGRAKTAREKEGYIVSEEVEKKIYKQK